MQYDTADDGDTRSRFEPIGPNEDRIEDLIRADRSASNTQISAAASRAGLSASEGEVARVRAGMWD